MPGVKKIGHKGTEILFIDYKGCRSEEEMLDILKQSQQIIIDDNREYLQLVDITDAFATPSYMKEAKKVAKDTPKLARKRAIVGINSSGRKILLKGYNLMLGKNALRPFDHLDEAKDWLVQP